MITTCHMILIITITHHPLTPCPSTACWLVASCPEYLAAWSIMISRSSTSTGGDMIMHMIETHAPSASSTFLLHRNSAHTKRKWNHAHGQWWRTTPVTQVSFPGDMYIILIASMLGLEPTLVASQSLTTSCIITRYIIKAKPNDDPIGCISISSTSTGDRWSKPQVCIMNRYGAWLHYHHPLLAGAAVLAPGAPAVHTSWEIWENEIIKEDPLWGHSIHLHRWEIMHSNTNTMLTFEKHHTHDHHCITILTINWWEGELPLRKVPKIWNQERGRQIDWSTREEQVTETQNKQVTETQNKM